MTTAGSTAPVPVALAYTLMTPVPAEFTAATLQ